MKKTSLAFGVFAVMSAAAGATSTPTSYDLGQDGRIESAASRADAAQNSANAAYALANTKYTEGAGKFLEGRVNALQEASVGKAQFEQDQQRQDAITATIGGQVTHLNGQMLNANRNITQNKADQAIRDAGQDEHIDAVQSAAQAANEKADAGAVRLDTAEGNIRETNSQMSVDRQQRIDADAALTTRIEQEQSTRATQDRVINNRVRAEEGARAAGDAALNVRIEQEQSNRATQDRVITDRVRKEEVNRASADAGLSARIDTKVDNSAFTQRSAVVDQRFVDTQHRIDANKAEQAKVNKAVASTLDNHEQRLSAVEQNTNSKFANIDKRIDEVKDEAHAGAASAMAQANIPQVMAEGEFGLGAGAGTYAGESAVAVGASFAPRQDLVFKATVSTDTQHNFGAGAGVMVSFR